MKPLTEEELRVAFPDMVLDYKRPRSKAWRFNGRIAHRCIETGRQRLTHQRRYHRRGMVAISEYSPRVQLPGQPEEVTGPTWVLSVSYRGRRPNDAQVALALKAFDMEGAEEDNHGPGIARHFFLPCDPASRGVCECKENEDQITEPDGYVWSNPKPGEGECRGCKYERLFGYTCTIHSEVTA